MRTFGPPLAAIALGVALVSPSMASAQRNGRRSTSGHAAPRAANAAANPCSENCGDYSLSIVSALLPSESSGAPGAEFVTFVIENRGTAPAPVSFISVAPKNQLAAARHSTIPALAPGERATVRLPVETGPDGTQCISITISPAPVRDPGTAQALASATPNPGITAPTPATVPDLSRPSELPYWPNPPKVFVAPDDALYANADDASYFDAIRKSEAFGSMDA
ncbi:MAG: hypothetical protein ABI035_03775 [Gemmatimonadaceae bacterium]